ncbi:hypothetical protein CYMTET_7335 [Cymbomonas tetramitiformis]|uniref:Uncharacterized protein n=1 Tax=Cymbomonas tetramitiformis TaxID=36881 RepID=A0AAE0GVP7_9CHLO|nr:hypothetical protein CYMTET_7335 [Cymbomonas tetramitiformis]
MLQTLNLTPTGKHPRVLSEQGPAQMKAYNDCCRSMPSLAEVDEYSLINRMVTVAVKNRDYKKSKARKQLQTGLSRSTSTNSSANSSKGAQWHEGADGGEGGEHPSWEAKSEGWCFGVQHDEEVPRWKRED